MLTIQRNRNDKRNAERRRSYEERPVQDYRTLEEDYQESVRINKNQNEDQLWDRLVQPGTTENNYDIPQRNYRRDNYRETRNYDNYSSNSYVREKNTAELPLYTTGVPDASMAMKKYNIKHEKKKGNTVGKVIIAAYIAVVTLVATLVIVDSTMKTSSAASSVPENESQIEYVQPSSQESTNWFDNLCDWFSKVAGE